MDLSDAPLDAAGTRPALELRVLSGRQSGARALLPSDGGWTRLGRLADNDLVLRDAPFDEAALSLQEAGWTWRSASGQEVVLQPGQGVRVGGFVLLLCRPSQPWADGLPDSWAIDTTADPSADDAAVPASVPQEDNPPLARSEPTLDPNALPQAARVDPPIDASATAVAALAAPGEATAQVASKGARTGRWVLAASCLTLAGLAWFAYPLLVPAEGGAAGAVAMVAPAATPTPDPQQNLQAVAQLLAQQPTLAAGVRAEPGPQERVRLLGVVADDEALETLLRPFVRGGIRVSLMVLTQAEFQSRVAAMANSLPEGLSAKALSDGRIRLQGVVDDASALPGIEAMIRQEVPEMAGLDVLAKPQADLRRAEAARRLARPAPVVVEAPLEPLPAVVSVIGGANPSIVLEGGQRLTLGGRAGVWEVSTIGASSVSFVDQAGRSRSLQVGP